MLVTLLTILKSFSISLGVGSSTLAITNFFVAIADGKIDPTERRMMGVVYVVLRIAMGLILVTTLLLLCMEYGTFGLMEMSAFSAGQLVALFVLYANALLMTAHLVPSTFGPAIQAGSWYTLGTLAALQITGQTDFTFTTFLLAYLTWIALAIGIVNAIMEIMKQKNDERKATEPEKTE
jgi:hypothetical protein